MCFIDVTISQDTNNLTRALNKSYHQKRKHLKLAVCFFNSLGTRRMHGILPAILEK